MVAEPSQTEIDSNEDEENPEQLSDEEEEDEIQNKIDQQSFSKINEIKKKVQIEDMHKSEMQKKTVNKYQILNPKI